LSKWRPKTELRRPMPAIATSPGKGDRDHVPHDEGHMLTRQARQCLHAASYSYDRMRPRVGCRRAEALGQLPAQVFKTRMPRSYGKRCASFIPSMSEASMKRSRGLSGQRRR